MAGVRRRVDGTGGEKPRSGDPVKALTHATKALVIARRPSVWKGCVRVWERCKRKPGENHRGSKMCKSAADGGVARDLCGSRIRRRGPAWLVAIGRRAERVTGIRGQAAQRKQPARARDDLLGAVGKFE